MEANIRVKHIGDLKNINNSTKLSIERAVQATKTNTGMTVVVAINYGGRQEIVDAVKNIVTDQIAPDDITESTLQKYLYTSHLPDPDLIIRTGGQFRTSNFLLWQSAYSEYYVTETLWPDFSVENLKEALSTYQNRQRRFGNVEPN